MKAHDYTATVRWRREPGAEGARYSRVHEWVFDGGAVVTASASPQIVPAPWSSPAAVDPEEAFVAALSACHMLFFVHHATDAGHAVQDYLDDAVGTMGPDADGRIVMLEVRLHPRIAWLGAAPSPQQVEDLHHRAHEDCFLANSVRCPVRVITP